MNVERVNGFLVYERRKREWKKQVWGGLKTGTVVCEEALVSGWLFGWVGHAGSLQFYDVPTMVLYFIRAASHTRILRYSVAPEVSHNAYQKLCMLNEIREGQWVRRGWKRIVDSEGCYLILMLDD